MLTKNLLTLEFLLSMLLLVLLLGFPWWSPGHGWEAGCLLLLGTQFLLCRYYWKGYGHGLRRLQVGIIPVSALFLLLIPYQPALAFLVVLQAGSYLWLVANDLQTVRTRPRSFWEL